MKYKWSNRKFWKSWILQDFTRLYYKFRLGENIPLNPKTGVGSYCTVKVIGDITIIKYHDKDVYEFDEVRIIPMDYNHGVGIERYNNGVMCDRHIMTINQFQKDIIFASNVEQLPENL